MSQSMAHGFDTMLQVGFALDVLVVLVWPRDSASGVDGEGERRNSDDVR
jgi:hypothetical protein